MIPCYICGVSIHRTAWDIKRSKHIYCSRKCQDVSRKTGSMIKCDRCGKQAYKAKVHLTKNERHFCSIDCWNQTQFDESEQTKIRVCKICGRNFKSKRHCKKNKGYWNVTCSPECRIKLRNSKSIYVECKYCGKPIKTAKALKERKRFCSKDCQNAYKTAENTFNIRCKGCGKLLVKPNSHSRYNTDAYCSRACMDRFRKHAESPAWKGGWFLNSRGWIMINVGMSNVAYKGHPNGHHQYKSRYRVIVELARQQPLPRNCPVLHLNGIEDDDRIENLYICSSPCEIGKILQGALPHPSYSNVMSFVLGNTPANYKRHPDIVIQQFIDDSFENAGEKQ